MRSLIVIALALVAACPGNEQPGADGYGGDDNGMEHPTTGGAPECSVASDCAPAAATCCDCPSYAAPKSDPAVQACSGVMCPPGNTCPANVEVACNAGRCELACVAMTCSNSCANGYALDASGCLSCDCAEVTTSACAADADCTEVDADCCGCAAGGKDTSVATADHAAWNSMLAGMCPASPTCPGANTCDANAVPSCVQGACQLIEPVTGTPCGRDDLPACPTGTACIVNASNPANDHRVGVCL